MNTGKKAVFDESTVTTSTNEYAKQAQNYDAEVINTPNLPNQSINTAVNNLNDEHPNKDPLANERTMELPNTGETSEQTTYEEVVATRPVLSATGEMTKNPVPNIFLVERQKSQSQIKKNLTIPNRSSILKPVNHQ